mgnify:CR=1 FL=1
MRIGAVIALCTLLASGVFAAEPKRVILLVSEQNIEAPQRAWWASEVDLSATEGAISRQLIASGYEVIDPDSVSGIIEKKQAFRTINMSEKTSLQLGQLSKADYVVLGKAVASAGGNVPQSSMRSCFANLTAKVIRVKDGKTIAFFESAGHSAHMDPITGGREALIIGADDLAIKISTALSKDSGGN